MGKMHRLKKNKIKNENLLVRINKDTFVARTPVAHPQGPNIRGAEFKIKGAL